MEKIRSLRIMKVAVLLAVAVVVFTLPAIAQKAKPATVVKLKKDRSGKRYANRWTVRCGSAGEVWSTGKLKASLRKMYVKAGKSDLKIGEAAPPESIGFILDGSNIRGWSTLKAGHNKDYGNPSRLSVICVGPGSFYAHAEWNRKKTSIFDF